MSLNNLSISSQQEPEFQNLLDKLYENYQNELDLMGEEAADEIETAIARGWLDKQQIVTDWVQAAAKRADEYYHAVRQAWQQYAGVTMPSLDDYDMIDVEQALWESQTKLINSKYIGLRYRDALTGNNKYGVTMADLWPDMTNVDDAQQFIADMMRNGARLQTMYNMQHDPTNPRWARVPSGAKTCAFCMMLASRGFAYLSEDTAGRDGNRYHDDCDCKIIPSWGKQTLKGYNLEQYQADYKKAVQYAQSHGMDRHHGKRADHEDEILKAMRRVAPDKVTDGVWETSKPWPEDEVIHISGQTWNHIFLNHRHDSTVPNKTHWPKEWDDEKIKWATKETVCAPDTMRTSPDGMKQRRYKLIEDQYIEVYLKKRRKTKGRFGVESAYPMSEQQRRNIGK